jgi:hypothetical protein
MVFSTFRISQSYIEEIVGALTQWTYLNMPLTGQPVDLEGENKRIKYSPKEAKLKPKASFEFINYIKIRANESHLIELDSK